MREILFRGKRTDNGEWVYGYISETTLCGCSDTHLAKVIYKIPQKIYDTEWFEVNPETVGQYTGCCDKSKTTKVFEGDIVWDEINEQYGVVEFDEGEFIVNFDGNVDCDRFADVISCCYVCGNIHDNPELIR